MGYFDGMFMPATGMGDIEAKCPAFHDVDQVITCTSGAKVGGPNCWPLQNDDIAGMDYASPESSCFQDAAVAERMDQHLRLVYLASKEVNKHKSGLDIVPKVYHVHCGEGFPIYDKEKYFIHLINFLKNGAGLDQLAAVMLFVGMLTITMDVLFFLQIRHPRVNPLSNEIVHITNNSFHQLHQRVCKLVPKKQFNMFWTLFGEQNMVEFVWSHQM